MPSAEVTATAECMSTLRQGNNQAWVQLRPTFVSHTLLVHLPCTASQNVLALGPELGSDYKYTNGQAIFTIYFQNYQVAPVADF